MLKKGGKRLYRCGVQSCAVLMEVSHVIFHLTIYSFSFCWFFLFARDRDGEKWMSSWWLLFLYLFIIKRFDAHRNILRVSLLLSLFVFSSLLFFFDRCMPNYMHTV
jgi:hypothetical protein